MPAAGDADNAAAMATWEEERKHLLATIKRQEGDAARLAKRFKLLQRTLAEQQKVLDRYQQALLATGAISALSGTDEQEHQQHPPMTREEPKQEKKEPLGDAPNDTDAPSPPPFRLLASPSPATSLKNATNCKSHRTSTPPTRPATKKSPSGHVPLAPGESGSAWLTRKRDLDFTDRVEKAHPLTKPPGADAVKQPPRRPTLRDGNTSTESSHGDRWDDSPVPTSGQTKKPSKQPASEGKRPAPTSFVEPKWKRRSLDETRQRSWKENNKENAFPYVEVVRNRAERASLPAHDCAECRKYYDALDGLITDSEIQHQKARCSRHRARFEPYQTPDDFWRLSFPDSETTSP